MQVELFRETTDSNPPRQCFNFSVLKQSAMFSPFKGFFYISCTKINIFYHLNIHESSFNAVKSDWCYQTLITIIVITSTFEKVILNSGQSN